MRIVPFVGLLLISLKAFAQTAADRLWEEGFLGDIHIQMHQDSLDSLMADPWSNHYFPVEFSWMGDTLRDVGIRIRGNTSRNSPKKSFKISFNEFVSGRAYAGVRKLNLLAMHNDPTVVRQKLFYDVWNRCGLTTRRATFAKLFINGAYRGVYTNAEEIDKIWLAGNFSSNTGNLYKCTWPADLVYLGQNQANYKAIMNGVDRAYDLQTNETADDYSDFVRLCAALDLTDPTQFVQQVQAVLDVDNVIKAYALDIATGNWDDYAYNKNNFYLYFHPVEGKFKYLTFDTDNTFGIDWLGIDWAQRNAENWYHPTQPRPLVDKILRIPSYRARFTAVLDSLTNFVVHHDSLSPLLDVYKNRLLSAVASDAYYAMSYGYTLGDFINGFDQTVDQHSPYGIRPFLLRRRAITLSFLTTLPDLDDKWAVSVGPNPCFGLVKINAQSVIRQVEAYTLDGQLILNENVTGNEVEMKLPNHQGAFFLLIRLQDGAVQVRKMVAF